MRDDACVRNDGLPLFIPSLVAVAVLVLVHVFAHKLKFLEGTPRSRWLSAAGGISLAYVFLHLLPELAEGQEVLAEQGLGVAAIEFEIYGLALVGLLVFYGIERYVQVNEEVGRKDIEEDLAAGVDMDEIAEEVEHHPSFWLHLATFGLYNAIIGYLLVHREDAEGHGEAGHGTTAGHGGSTAHGAEQALADGATSMTASGELASLATFAIAMALHFLVTDYGLREDFRNGWRTKGRWLLSAAVVIGWLLGLALELPEIAVLGLIALLGGGVILNVLKEELPEERKSRFGALMAGAAGYTVLLALAH